LGTSSIASCCSDANWDIAILANSVAKEKVARQGNIWGESALRCEEQNAIDGNIEFNIVGCGGFSFSGTGNSEGCLGPLATLQQTFGGIFSVSGA